MSAPGALAREYGPLWDASRDHVKHAVETMQPTVRPPSMPFHGAGSWQFSATQMWAAIASAPVVPLLFWGLGYRWYPAFLIALGLPVFAVYVYSSSWWLKPPSQKIPLPGKPIEHYVTFRDAELQRKYGTTAGGKRAAAQMPIEELVEAYFDEKLDFNGDVLDVLEQRYDFAAFKFTPSHVKFFLTQWVPETLWHSRKQDEDQVREHYDRGNDFYAAFLGQRMIYTSGLISDPAKHETLEQIQDNKLEYVARVMQLKPGDRHLDLGCGWGTLLVHAARHYGTHSTGVTLASNQIEFGTQRAAELGVSDRVRFLHMDYRDVPRQKYDKITCLEMAEHVGVRKFPQFLAQMSEMLEDDGLFFLQIAGLRRRWTFEDLIWGLFMAKYVFPGADASCPLAWVIGQLEAAGFEVREVQTIGVHYSATINRWYNNWRANKERVRAEYGTRWVRIWEVFLAWSTIIARQGSATCYQIVAHKNVNKFNRAGLMRNVSPAAHSIETPKI